MKIAALYIRVSTEEQRKHGLSVDNQLVALQEYCENNNLQYKVYNDAGISGHASYKRRPALLQLIDDCQNNKISIILFTRLDRWFRSVKDYYLVQDQICNVPWKAIWEDYETETSSGQLKVNIMLSIAEAEATRTSEKIKSVMDYKRSKGEWLGKVPLGFKLSAEKKLEKDPDTEKYADLMFKIYLSTMSTMQTSIELTKAGYKISQTSVSALLGREYYIGTYITEEDHNRIIQWKKAHYHGQSQMQFDYFFNTMIKCPNCNKKLSGAGGTLFVNGRRGKYAGKGYTIGYRCTKDGRCTGYYLSERNVENFLLNNLDGILQDEHTKYRVKNKDNINDSVDAIEKKISRLTELYIEGEISKKDYATRKASFEAQKASLQAVKQTEPPTIPNDWKEIYNSLDRKHKALFWRSIIKRIDLIEPDDKKNFLITFN